jgi:small subunit ribosomal protein S16
MVKIRLMRLGAKKRPYYRVVVADSRQPRDGRYIEQIGKYHPLVNPSLIEIDEERALHWLKNGAQPTEPAEILLRKTGIWEKHTGQPEPPPKPEKVRKPKKAAAAEVPPAAAEAPTPEPKAEEEAAPEPPVEPAEEPAPEPAEPAQEPAPEPAESPAEAAEEPAPEPLSEEPAPQPPGETEESGEKS